MPSRMLPCCQRPFQYPAHGPLLPHTVSATLLQARKITTLYPDLPSGNTSLPYHALLSHRTSQTAAVRLVQTSFGVEHSCTTLHRMQLLGETSAVCAGVGDVIREEYTESNTIRLCRDNGRVLREFSFEECEGGPHEFYGVSRAFLQSVRPPPPFFPSLPD